jgi:hypothetical protein
VRKLMSGLLMRSSRQSAERPSANNDTKKMNALTTYDSHFGGVVTRRSASAWVRDLVAAAGLRRFRLRLSRLVCHQFLQRATDNPSGALKSVGFRIDYQVVMPWVTDIRAKVAPDILTICCVVTAHRPHRLLTADPVHSYIISHSELKGRH